jgi:hypothetical protein
LRNLLLKEYLSILIAALWSIVDVRVEYAEKNVSGLAKPGSAMKKLAGLYLLATREDIEPPRNGAEACATCHVYPL